MALPQIGIQSKEKRIRNFREVVLGFPKRAAMAEAMRCPQCADPRCRTGCPLGVDIPGFVRLIREGDCRGALERIKEQNAFPGVCGRICPAPCEQACVLQEEGAPIAIRMLERYAADNGRAVLPSHRRHEPQGASVAIIGAGPAGLTAAAHLARQGYQVTVFDAFPFCGGVLSYGIPGFRLPPRILETEIEDIARLGVRMENHSLIGQGLRVNELFNKGFSAVLLAVGMGDPHPPDIIGTHLARVYYIAEFLMQTAGVTPARGGRRIPIAIGEQVAVLGDNSAALDAAAMCLRLGKKVSVVFDRTEEELEGVSSGRLSLVVEEGTQLEGMTRPLRILSDNQQGVCGVECIKMDFADPDHSGRWRLIPVPGSEFTVDADTVIIASGNKPNTTIFQAAPQLRRRPDNGIWMDERLMTSLKGVFAAGSFALGPVSVVEAMASGKRSAESMGRFLREEA